MIIYSAFSPTHAVILPPKIIVIYCIIKRFLARAYNRKQSFFTHLRRLVTVFKKSTQKFSIFYFKMAKNCSTAGCSAPKPPVFLYYSHTALLKNTCRLSCMFWNEFIKLYDQLCILYLKNLGNLKITNLNLQMHLVLS